MDALLECQLKIVRDFGRYKVGDRDQREDAKDRALHRVDAEFFRHGRVRIDAAESIGKATHDCLTEDSDGL